MTVPTPIPACYCPAGRLSGHPRHAGCWPVERERRPLEETVFVDDGLGDEMEADLARGIGDDD